MKKILLILTGLSVLLFADFSRDNSTKIVTDNTTSLQWQDDSDAKTVTKTWIEAINYCEALTLGGYSDWRLPNFHELYYLADRSKRYPAIDGTFQNVVSDNYWSSTSVVGRGGLAWGVYFYIGHGRRGAKSRSYYVRCVRAGQ